MLQLHGCLISLKCKYAKEKLEISESLKFFSILFERFKNVTFNFNEDLIKSLKSIISNQNNKKIIELKLLNIPFEIRNYLIDELNNNKALFNNSIFIKLKNSQEILYPNLDLEINEHSFKDNENVLLKNILEIKKESSSNIFIESIEENLKNENFTENFEENNYEFRNELRNDLLNDSIPLNNKNPEEMCEMNKSKNYKNSDIGYEKNYFPRSDSFDSLDNDKNINDQMTIDINLDDNDIIHQNNFIFNQIIDDNQNYHFVKKSPKSDFKNVKSFDGNLKEDIKKKNNENENNNYFERLNNQTFNDDEKDIITFGNNENINQRKKSCKNLNLLLKECNSFKNEEYAHQEEMIIESEKEKNSQFETLLEILVQKLSFNIKFDYLSFAIGFFKKFIKKIITTYTENGRFYKNPSLNGFKLHFLFEENNYENFIKIAKMILYLNLIKKDLIENGSVNDNNNFNIFDFSQLIESQRYSNDENLLNDKIISIQNSSNIKIIKNLFLIKAEFLILIIKLLKNLSFKDILDINIKINNSYSINNGNLIVDHSKTTVDFIIFVKDLIINYLKSLKSICEKRCKSEDSNLEKNFSSNSEFMLYIYKILDLFNLSIELNSKILNEIFQQNYKEIYLFVIIPFLKRSEDISEMYLNLSNEYFDYFIGNYLENYRESIKSKVCSLSKNLTNISNDYTNFVANLNLDILIFHILKFKIKRDKYECTYKSKNKEIESYINISINNSKNEDENLFRLIMYENVFKLITRFKEFIEHPNLLQIENKHSFINNINNDKNFINANSLNEILCFFFPGLKFNLIDIFSNYYMYLKQKHESDFIIFEVNQKILINGIDENISNIENSVFKRIFEIFLEDKNSQEKLNSDLFSAINLIDTLEIIFISLASIMDSLFENKSLFIKFNLYLKTIFKDFEKMLNSKDELTNIHFALILFLILKKELPYNISEEDIEVKNYGNEHYLDMYLDFLLRFFNQNKISNKTNSNSKNQILIYFIDNLFFPEQNMEFISNKKGFKKNPAIENMYKLENEYFQLSNNSYKKEPIEKKAGNYFESIIEYSDEEYKQVRRRQHLIYNGLSVQQDYEDDLKYKEIQKKNKSLSRSQVNYSDESKLRKYMKSFFFEKHDFLMNIYNNHLKSRDSFSLSSSLNKFLSNLINHGYLLIEGNIFILTRYFLSEIINDIEEKISSISNVKISKSKGSFTDKFKNFIKNNFNKTQHNEINNLNKQEKKDFCYSNILFLEAISKRIFNNKDKTEKRNFFKSINSLFSLAPKIIISNYPHEDEIFIIINIYLSYLYSFYENYNIGNFTRKQIKCLLAEIDELYLQFKEIIEAFKFHEFLSFQNIHINCFLNLFKLFKLLNKQINLLIVLNNDSLDSLNKKDINKSNIKLDDYQMKENNNFYFCEKKEKEISNLKHYSQSNEMEVDSQVLEKITKKPSNESEKENTKYIRNNNKNSFVDLFRTNNLQNNILLSKTYEVFFCYAKLCFNNYEDISENENFKIQPFLKSESNTLLLITLIGNLLQNWEFYDFDKINSIGEQIINLINNNNNDILIQDFHNKLNFLNNLIVLKIFELFTNQTKDYNNSDKGLNENNSLHSNKYNDSFKTIAINITNGNQTNAFSIRLINYLDKINPIIRSSLNSEPFGCYLENIISVFTMIKLLDFYLDDLEMNLLDNINLFNHLSINLENNYYYNSYLTSKCSETEKPDGINLIKRKLFIIVSIYQFIIERLNILKIYTNIENNFSGFIINRNKIQSEIIELDEFNKNNYYKTLDIINNLNHKFENLNIGLNTKRYKGQIKGFDLEDLKKNENKETAYESYNKSEKVYS